MIIVGLLVSEVYQLVLPEASSLASDDRHGAMASSPWLALLP